MLRINVSMGAEPTGSGYLDGDEVSPALIGHRLGEQRFAAARRAEEQDAGRHGQADGRKLLRVPDGLRDGERELLPDLHCDLEADQRRVNGPLTSWVYLSAAWPSDSRLGERLKR